MLDVAEIRSVYFPSEITPEENGAEAGSERQAFPYTYPVQSLIRERYERGRARSVVGSGHGAAAGGGREGVNSRGRLRSNGTWIGRYKARICRMKRVM